MASNEYYGALNVRFDEREQELIKLGYKREVLSGYNLAVYVRQRYGRTHVVQTAAMHFADDYGWNDIRQECQRFCNV